MSGEHRVEAVFRTLGDYCTELLAVDGIGVLLLEDAKLVVATANSGPGEMVERLEAELEEGPCTDALRTSALVAVPDLAAETGRWPNFAPRALAAGVHSIHGLPMGGRSGLPIGALNIITVERRALVDDELRIADMLSDVAVAYLVSIRAGEQANELAGHLQRALDSRVVIEQAKGVLVGRHGGTMEAAFDRLRGHARATHRRLHDVARDVCAGTLDLE